jgi:hypothetical protein
MIQIVQKNGDASIELVALDESFNPSVETTSDPVESGKVMTEHTFEAPIEIDATVRVSQATLDLSGNSISENTREVVLDFFETVTGQLVTYHSSKRGTFENCIITSWPSTDTLDGHTDFRLSLQQILLPEFETVRIPPEAPAERHQSGAPDEQDVGKQTKQQRTPQKAGQTPSEQPEDTTDTDTPSKQTDAETGSTLHGLTFGG